MTDVNDTVPVTADDNQEGNNTTEQETFAFVQVNVITPDQKTITLSQIVISEPIAVIKQTLTEFTETAFYTHYSLAIKNEDGSIQRLNDFTEIALSLPSEDATSITLHMILDDYDVKQIKLHIKRLRDVISNPPSIRSADLESAEPVDDLIKITEPNPSEFPTIQKLLSKVENITVSPKLGDYYNETLLRTGRVNTELIHSTGMLAKALKTVAISSWNPPPASRKLQGDLAYLEVVTIDGTFHITATAKGFYVNNSTEQTFDPKPKKNASFSHELFLTVAQASINVHHSWNMYLKSIAKSEPQGESKKTAGMLDTVATMYASGKGDQVSFVPQWNAPTTDLSPNQFVHTYDANRVQDELSDNFGIDERGANREWNEEIQSFRMAEANDLNEKVTKARYCHKITSEFVEASKQLVKAILDGQIAPLNYGEEEFNLVYLYNGIFVSRAVSTKDSFKAFFSDEACRKAAGQDLRNQKLLLRLGVQDLSNVLHCIVDIRGQRFIAQTMIPGVLSTGTAVPRLVHGALDAGQRISVKEDAAKVVESLQQKLHLKKSTIKPVAPVFAGAPAADEAKAESAAASTNSLIKRLDGEKAPPIRVDDENEVNPLDAESINFVGPIEGKLIKGSDNRIYCIDMYRLTPRDANYVKGEKGTGNIAADKLDKASDELFVVYCLRQELIAAYQQVNSAEQVEINPNVFLPESVDKNGNAFTGDINDAELQKDEETARKLAKFLWENVLPSLTYQVRTGDLVVFDNQSLVDVLHSQGVNMRYLGQLAKLASDQEKEDIALATQNQQRIHTMPIYWLGLLEIEMFSRAVKHTIRQFNQQFNGSTSLVDSELVSLVLNAVLGGANTTPVATETATPAVESAEKKSSKKKKSKNQAANTVSLVSSTVPAFHAYNLTREEILNKVLANLLERFCYEDPELANTTRLGDDEEAKKTGKVVASDNLPFLTKRVNKLTLLRRICQQTGLRVSTRDYDFESVSPFAVEDIIDITSRVKSCESDVILPEASELLLTSKLLQHEKNYQESFEMAQEASQLLQQTVGQSYKDVITSMNQMATLLHNVGDSLAALNILSKVICLTIQVFGFDSYQVLQQHVHIAVLLCELKQYEQAIHHLYTAKYLIHLLGNEHHPELVTIYCQLALVASELGDYTYSCNCYLLARLYCNDLSIHTSLTESIAEIYAKQDKVDEALFEQRICHKLFSDILGETNPKTTESKERMEKYRRAVTERNVTEARERQQTIKSTTRPVTVVSEPAQVFGKSPVVSTPTVDSDKIDAAKKSNKKKSNKKK